MTPEDFSCLEDVLQHGVDGSLIVQEYEAGIEFGEYSLGFIDGQYTHTMLRKPARGEFRCQAEFEGGIEEVPVESVPAVARQTATRIMAFLDTEVVNAKCQGSRMEGQPSAKAVPYCRVDGVMRKTGEFVLMEIEAIEPHLWLETSTNEATWQALYNRLLRQ